MKFLYDVLTVLMIESKNKSLLHVKINKCLTFSKILKEYSFCKKITPATEKAPL